MGWTSLINGKPGYGTPKTIVEIKFAGDRFRGESGGTPSPQRQNYQAIANRYGANFETLDMNTSKKKPKPDCNCKGDEPEEEPETQPQKNSAAQKIPDNPPPLYIPPPTDGALPAGKPALEGLLIRTPVLVE